MYVSSSYEFIYTPKARWVLQSVHILVHGGSHNRILQLRQYGTTRLNLLHDSNIYNISDVRIGESVQFAKFGYLELPSTTFPHISSQSEEEIRLTVQTDQSHGLLFYQGQLPNQPGRGLDYIAIAIHSGYVSFRYFILDIRGFA